jgi:hypothetical protein
MIADKRGRCADLFLLAAAAICLAAGTAGRARPPQAATLVLALDGIGFSHAIEAYERGLLEGFQPPVPVISTFPSLTSVAFTGMVHPLGYPAAPGYENRHYDWKRNKVRGGFPYITFPWHRYFTLDRNSVVRKTLGYFWPRWLCRMDVDRVLEAVLDAPEPFLTAYLANPDALAHMKGKEAGVELLAYLRRRLAKLRPEYRTRHGRELRVIVISDHGQTCIRQRPVHGLKDHLSRGGFRLQGRLSGENSVVIARFGYVEACMLYCREPVKARLARWLVRLDGIELCAYAEAGAVAVVSWDGGEARVEAREPAQGGPLLRYRPLRADPLRHVRVRETLRRLGRLDAEGFAPAQEWLEHSVEADFPDALTRLHHAFFGQDIENKASVIFSTLPGRAYGHPVTRGLSWLRGGRLEATHGGLGSEASLALLLTDDAALELPAVLRYDQLLPWIERLRPLAP